MKRKFMRTIMSTGLIFCFVNIVSGYEVIEFPNGGSVAGTVTFTGTVPAEKPLEVSKDVEHCGTDVTSEILMVGPDKGLKFTVIYLEGIEKGKPSDKTVKPVLDNESCRFVPHVQSATTGQKLEIRNSDPILHNTHAFSDQKTFFNLALPLQDQKILKRLRESGFMSIKCDAGHTWMSAYIAVFDHPYHTTTDEKGSFKIENIPPGTYTLKAWHEKLGESSQEVVITEGGDKSTTFSFN